MLTYVTVGANDVPLSERFYTAVLSPLGYKKKEVPKGVEYIALDAPGRGHHPNAVYLGKPFDGKEATVGNGSMLAFQAETHEIVVVDEHQPKRVSHGDSPRASLDRGRWARSRRE